jgi:secondary thiamine-phosphate synthase enzyme
MSAARVESRIGTGRGLEVIDITDGVADAVPATGVSDGICWVYSPSTTCVVRLSESEAGLLDDFVALLRRLVHNHGNTANDDLRCLSILLGGVSEAIPIAGGALRLGTWQRVLFLKLDPGREARARDRWWHVQVVGC